MKNFNFGNYICELREKKGLSQSQLGEKLGVTNKAVSRWENGSAYPSTELMLPLAKALSVTIEDLYKAISEDKEKKTKIRIVLEYLVQKTKIITIIGLILMVIPYVLFACFSKMSDKGNLLLATPIIALIVYVMFYLVFIVMRKNPFCSNKVADIYTLLALIFLSIGYVSMFNYYITYFPDGLLPSSLIVPAGIVAVIHSLKRRYK